MEWITDLPIVVYLLVALVVAGCLVLAELDNRRIGKGKR